MARRDIRINSKGFILVFVNPYNHGLCQPRTIFFYDNRDNKDNKEKKDSSRIFNAFALTARMDNAQLHPGCRCALPWAMRSLGFQPVTTLKNGQPDHSHNRENKENGRMSRYIS